MVQKTGKLIVVSAPSGAGKTTLVKHLLQSINKLQFSISATSRDKRANEIDGRDYYFMSPLAFRQKIDAGEFLEWEEVYEGVFYGTLRHEVNRITTSGSNVIFDVDVVGGLNIKKQFPHDALSIFIQPPNLEELEKRLRNRSTDPEESLQKRLAKSAQELEYAIFFDVIVINDQLEQAKEEIVQLVNKFINDEAN